MNQYLLILRSESEEIPCTAMPSGQPGLGLDETGITWQDDSSPLRIEVIENELHIARESSFRGQVDIVRNGRCRSLAYGQSIRLLVNDDILLNGKKYSVQSVVKGNTSRLAHIFDSLRTSSRAIMLTSAAALVLTGCSLTVHENKLSGAVATVVPEEENTIPAQSEESSAESNAEQTECNDFSGEETPVVEETIKGNVDVPEVINTELRKMPPQADETSDSEPDDELQTEEVPVVRSHPVGKPPAKPRKPEKSLEERIAECKDIDAEQVPRAKERCCVRLEKDFNVKCDDDDPMLK